MRFVLDLRHRPPLPEGFAERAGFLVLVALTGAGMGLVAVAFRLLLRESNVLFFGRFHGLDLTTNLLDRPYIALVPAAGGLLVGRCFLQGGRADAQPRPAPRAIVSTAPRGALP